MRSQDILVFCFILGSCLVSSAYSDSADKRARNFLGKRDSADTKNEDNKSVLNDDFVKRVQEYMEHNDFLDDGLDEDKRGPRFLGKRADDIDEEKRRHSFLGKRRPSFLGKRGPHFLGKRGGRYFLGKRGRYFLGKRDGDDEDMDTIDEEKRRHFLGKREGLDDSELGELEDEMEKRRHFLGKRVSRNFIGK